MVTGVVKSVVTTAFDHSAPTVEDIQSQKLEPDLIAAASKH